MKAVTAGDAGDAGSLGRRLADDFADRGDEVAILSRALRDDSVFS
jgi:hypothetical protein